MRTAPERSLFLAPAVRHEGDRAFTKVPSPSEDVEATYIASIAIARSNRSEIAYATTKRVLDLVVAALALGLLTPVLAVIVLAVWVQDPGAPVIYSQWRIGRAGRAFRFYKFRSMVRDADRLKAALAAQNEASGPIFKMRDDPRVTRVGRILRRYSLDELPQLFNVLRGDMSLVGPRPHLPSEIRRCQDYPMERLSVAPGLVCLREVHGRSRLTFREWIDLDLRYVRERSLGLDLVILLRVLPAVLKAEGAY